jgi:hypothetical protein
VSHATALADLEFRVEERERYAPLRKTKSNTRSKLRVLGEDEQDVGVVAPLDIWEDEMDATRYAPTPTMDAIFMDQAVLRRSELAVNPRHVRLPDFDTGWSHPSYDVDEDASWQYNTQIRNTQYAISTRIGLPGKRLPLFIILSMMAVGLVVAITPVLATSHVQAQPRRTGMSLSGYADTSTPPQVGNLGTVPIIDATSSKPPVLSSNSQPGEVVGSPSISVNQIEAVLKEYGSPAAGKGQVLFDLGVKYGINPAYALAFFVHESGCGTKGVARVTKSLGNIRTTPGYADYQGYRSYPTWESGMEDWYKLIANLYVGEWGLRTIDAIIPVYAPWGDSNNPPAYISSVKNMVSSWQGK